MQTRKKHDTGCSVPSCKWTGHENTTDCCVCRAVPCHAVSCRAVGTASAKLHFCYGPKLNYVYSCTIEPCASLKVKNALEQSVYCLAACAICNLIIAALIPAMSVCLLIPSVGLWVMPV